jgi:hypothetical protein
MSRSAGWGKLRREYAKSGSNLTFSEWRKANADKVKEIISSANDKEK